MILQYPFFGKFRYILSAKINETYTPLNWLHWCRKFEVTQKLVNFLGQGAFPCSLIVFPKISIFAWSYKHLLIESFRPAGSMRWNTRSMFSSNLSAVCAAFYMSSTYWVHLSAFSRGSSYLLTKLLNADNDLFKPWAGLF